VITGLKVLLRKIVAALLLGFHAVPTYACVANPLIGMIAPVGVEWFLLSPWSPFYWFWETRWLVFNMISIPTFYGVNINLNLGWGLFIAGLCVFLWAAGEFLLRRKEGLVTTGLYSHVRHPQYLGIMIASLGFTVASERPMSWIAWLNLVLAYMLLAYGEDKLLQSKYGQDIRDYRQQVPFILPSQRRIFSEKVRLPESNLRKALFLALVYFSVMTTAWIVLKQFSYQPGPFFT
jgi:protein-S-isoprenylcysteine O-methyltransferase Ste14